MVYQRRLSSVERLARRRPMNQELMNQTSCSFDAPIGSEKIEDTSAAPVIS